MLLNGYCYAPWRLVGTSDTDIDTDPDPDTDPDTDTDTDPFYAPEVGGGGGSEVKLFCWHKHGDRRGY